MSDDETRPIEPEAPLPPPAPEPQQAGQYGAPTPYAMPVPGGYPGEFPGHPGYPGYPGYPGHPGYAAQQRPRFADQVMGMRAVVAVALACLIIGGLSGFILGRASAHNQERFVRPGFGTFQRGGFPNGPGAFPNGPNGPNGGSGSGG